MKPMFADAAQQAFFAKNGWVKLPVLTTEQVAELKNYYEHLDLARPENQGFHVSMDQQNQDLVQATVAKIYAVALAAATAHLTDVKPFTASFLAKDPRTSTSIVPVHQDWTFVEEDQGYYSVTFWIALVDVDHHNGALGVINGSHRFFSNHRPSPSPYVHTPLANHQFTVFEYLQLVPLKAGEALVFDNRTFHGSPPNQADQTRLAVGLGFTQKDAQLCHYYQSPQHQGQRLQKYHVAADFFQHFNYSRIKTAYEQGLSLPELTAVATVPYTYETLSTTALTELILAHDNHPNTALADQVAALFQPATPPAGGQLTGQVAEAETDNRSFWQIYTPLNIVREFIYRVQKLVSRV